VLKRAIVEAMVLNIDAGPTAVVGLSSSPPTSGTTSSHVITSAVGQGRPDDQLRRVRRLDRHQGLIHVSEFDDSQHPGKGADEDRSEGRRTYPCGSSWRRRKIGLSIRALSPTSS
jgi:hypothetical protein